MRTVFLFFNLLASWVLVFSSPLNLARDTLNYGQKLVGNETIVSAGKIFELGFFSPNIAEGSKRYLGIWYHMQDVSEKQIVVWVANRDTPVDVDSIGVFQIADDGNLVVVNTSGNNKPYWSSTSNSNSSPKNRTVKLMDSGNLVLQDDDEHNRTKLWESFENPTDTFLPGMNMYNNLKLSSWRNENDPGSGNFSFEMENDNNRFIILNRTQIYWESEEYKALNFKSKFDSTYDVSAEVFNLLSNFSSLILSKPFPTKHYDNTRLFLNSKGVILWVDNLKQGELSVMWRQPKTNCSIYNICGNFTSCNDNDRMCNCLPGFYNDDMGDKVGCKRRNSASCNGTDDMTFLNLTMVKVGSPNKKFALNETDCKSLCLQMCPRCQAYSYAPPPQQRGLNLSPCWIWTHNLTTLKEDYINWDNRTLYVRVHKSDIAPTPRSCEPCGTKIVPYPLSTGSNCGDITYFNFRCITSTGQLTFFNTTTANNTVSYKVIRVTPSTRKFTIQNEDNSFNPYCESKLHQNLIVSSPFRLTNDNPCSEQVDISWEPPSKEPKCANPVDCIGWKYSTCSKGNKCVCNQNYYWSGENLTCNEKKESIQRNMRGRFYDSERHVKDIIDMEGLDEKDIEGIEVPYFDFESILRATNDFSDANKLGRGGYGPVYKGKLDDGQEVAVKRLSSVSSQGLQEFKNEVVLIAKLQHRNLVRLRGYCVKGEEKILLYEYMLNKSLDLFIFDSTKSVILDWQMRFDIILGIARGLLYLHQDSRLRVIHRDLKTSNILLDGEMQPKISDFGLARIFGGKEIEANTERVVGTYGYMSPEYALDGNFSTKSDIFSFGVVLLEIISGKKNTGFYRSKEISSLLGYAWSLWKEDKLQELMDLSLYDTYNENQFIKCSQIGLLCVQDEPDDRPNMSNVLTMLDNDTITLPTPKQPTFFMRKDLSSTASSSMQCDSIIQEGR
ncbi:G-type lectin S-receptor-like serine/threonine-protein kinase At4g03230 isoform X2 [Cicer arietinum]|uniref:non-specific serine/threonine protein kinase n=1 Tax=Cicer arietinum TaxID=3827 RepID=A0A3Q7WWB2_CICAR|nr:G-type lectin S-receptor-like serine/threonine-protein kinase At4g03230 isoform X2 [Cicer arietinum]